MKLRSTIASSLLVFALAACATPPPPSGSDAGREASVDSGPARPGAATCARVRALNCMGAATCEQAFDPAAALGPAVAACSAVFSTWVSCLDSNAAMVTCGDLRMLCATQNAAVEQCVQGSSDAGGGSDASEPADSGVRPLPSPAEWPMGDTQIELSGWSTGASSGPGGETLLGIGPIGTPANARMFQFSGVVHEGTVTNCRVGLLFDSAAGSYTFSNDANLTQVCEVAGSARVTSLTFTGAQVQFDPIGRLSVEITARATGGTLNGETGRISIAYNN
jgi:hypothetical protein